MSSRLIPVVGCILLTGVACNPKPSLPVPAEQRAGPNALSGDERPIVDSDVEGAKAWLRERGYLAPAEETPAEEAKP